MYAKVHQLLQPHVYLYAAFTIATALM